MFGFGGFDFSCACLTLHLSLSTRAMGRFKVTSLIGAIKSKLEIRLMVVAKLRLLLSTDPSEVVSSCLLVLSHQQVGITKKNTTTKHLCPVMVNGIGRVYPCGSNKGFSSKF